MTKFPLALTDVNGVVYQPVNEHNGCHGCDAAFEIAGDIRGCAMSIVKTSHSRGEPPVLCASLGAVWKRIEPERKPINPQDGHQFEMAQTNLHPDAWTLLGGQFFDPESFRRDGPEPTISDLAREIAELRLQIFKEKS